MDDADDAGEVSSGKITRGQHLAAWLVGEKEEEPGALAIVQVRAIYARAPKKGFLMKVAADPSIDDGSQLKVERLQFDASTGQLRPMAVGLRFGRISAAEVHCVLHPNPTAQPGVLELPAAEQLALDASIDGLRAAAVETIRERRLARARAKQQKDDLRRIQGRDDIERLTVPLMQEELRARRARGEEIEVTLTSRRDDLRRALAAARAANPDIPVVAAIPAPAAAAAAASVGLATLDAGVLAAAAVAVPAAAVALNAAAPAAAATEPSSTWPTIDS